MILFPIFFSVIMGAVLAWSFFDRREREALLDPPEKMQNTSIIDPMMLPYCLLIFAPLVLFVPFFRRAGVVLGGMLVVVIICISVYYTVLLCILPFLRRTFSSRACAAFWILPNYLYLLTNIHNVFDSAPLLVMPLPSRWLGIVGIIWCAGFVGLLLFQIISHLVYRRRLLRESITVSEGNPAQMWQSEQKRFGVRRMIPMVVSSETSTPLTIGCYKRTFRLVMPHTNYTEDELRLIFCHELRHIQNMDSRTKFFLGFCTAMCWFNPLVWIARRKVSDDLELSCDELVLRYENEQTREEYARLLLKDSDSDKGYTTCLSSAASTMRYRLKNVLHPRKKRSGTLVVGIILTLLLFFSGSIALADTTVSADTLLTNGKGEVMILKNVYGKTDPVNKASIPLLEEPLKEYLSSLSIRRLYTQTKYGTLEQGVTLSYASEDSWVQITLYDKVIAVNSSPDEQGLTRAFYVLEEKVDWGYLQTLIEFQ